MGYLTTVCKIRRLNPFYYLDYEKAEAQELLIDKYGWKYYGEHHHENEFTKFTLSYWLYEKFKIDKRIITYSGQVMNGNISRNEAIRILSNKPYDALNIENDIDSICEKLGMAKKELDILMTSPNKNVFDYPSRLNFVRKHKRLSTFVIRKILKYDALFLDQL